MHVQVKDYGGELFPEVLLAAIVRSSHSLIVEVLSTIRFGMGRGCRPINLWR
jgi:hypothetical protein